MNAIAPPPSRLAVGLLTVLVLGASCAAPDTGGALVERQRIAMTLLRDGSVEVRETMTVRLTGSPVTRFSRQVPGGRVDAFIDVRAAIDGQPVTTDDSVGTHVVIERGRALDVDWRFPAVTDTTREFVLEYRAVGVLAVHGANAQFYWPLLPLAPAYPVAETEVTLTVPSNTVFMTPPAVVADAPWETEVGATGLTTRRAGSAPAETAALSVGLATDTLALGGPDWQFNAALAAELVPAFISGGVFMVVVGIGILWMLRARYPDPRRVPEEGPSGAEAPAIAPAYRPVLRNRRRIRGRPELEAAMADLRDRAPAASTGRPGHEQVLVDELWLRKDTAGGTAEQGVAEAGAVRGAFVRALRADMAAAGLVDLERVSVASGLKASGVATILMALLCAAAVAIWLGRYGAWTYAVPAGMAVLGVMLLVAGERFVILTPAGERAARQ